MASVNVFVDDTDPRITYSGPWFTAPAPTGDIGFYGAVWNNTLHATQANASLSFTFSGIWIVLYTTSTTPAGLTGPRYQCFVDGVQQTIVGIADSSGPTNHWSTCGNDVLSDGPHVFTVNVTASANETAWVDFVKYAPSASVSLANETVLVQNFSPDIKFGAGWGPLPVSEEFVNPWSSSTNVTGSTFHYNFIGSSVIWYALATTYVSNNPAPCTYTIDGGSPVSFNTVGLSSRNPTQNEFFVVLFQSDTLSWGSHTLDVVYNGGLTDTPLILDYLIIQNRTAPSVLVGGSPTSGSGTATTSITSQNGAATTNGSGAQGSDSNTNPQPKKHMNTGAIVGGVVGGIALILLVLLGVWYMRRRRRRQRQTADSAQPHAFVLPPSPPPAAVGFGHEYAPVPTFVNDNSMASRPTFEPSHKYPVASPLPPTTSSSSRHAPSSLEHTGTSRMGAGVLNGDSKSVPLREARSEARSMSGDDMPPMYTPD